MSIRIRIGQEERDTAQADEHWVISKIRQEEANHGSVCIRVFIKVGDIDLILSSGGCPSGVGGERQARPKEQELLDLWSKFDLNTSDVSVGKINAFLHQIRRII